MRNWRAHKLESPVLTQVWKLLGNRRAILDGLLERTGSRVYQILESTLGHLKLQNESDEAELQRLTIAWSKKRLKPEKYEQMAASLEAQMADRNRKQAEIEAQRQSIQTFDLELWERDLEQLALWAADYPKAELGLDSGLD